MSRGYLRSSDGIAGDFSARIDELFAAWDRDHSPGAIVAVCRNGVVVHRRGYGVADIENDSPFTADTVLRLGSTTKHFCATCILILENRGSVNLDDDVRRYVPEMPDYRTPVTLRHLLTMTSGLWDGLNLLLFAGLDTAVPVSRDQLLRLVCTQDALMFRPGDEWSYSNTNYSLLTLVIERVGAMAMADFMDRELFRPLGMTRTCLTQRMTRVVAGKARGYVPDGHGGFTAGHMMIELDGAGGVDSTVADMLKWLANYRDDRHFGPDYRLRLEADSRLNDGRLLDYRCGIEVKDYRGVQVVRHAGGMPGYLCDFAFFPDTDLGIVMLANVLDPEMLKLPNAIADIVLEAELRQPLSTIRVDARRPDAAALTGVYASATHELVVELTEQNGLLVCYLFGDLHPLREVNGWFQSTKSPLAVRAAGRDADTTLELRLGCGPSLRLPRVGDPPQAPDMPEGDLEDYGGRYRNDGIGEVHELSVRDGRLHVEIPSPVRDLVWSSLMPVGADLFAALIEGEPSCTNVVVHFLRDTSGSVSELSYSINRCRGVIFRRIATLDEM